MRHPKALLDHFDILSSGENVTYVLSPERTITRTNAAWTKFACSNNGAQILEKWSVGADALVVCEPWLRAFYAHAFARTCVQGEPWGHEYECSSPEKFRRFRMIAYPYQDWLLVTHALVVELPHDAGIIAPESEYIDRGIVTMCMHCRRTRHRSHYERWDWVPGFVARPPSRVAHGLCPACFGYYYETRQ